VVVIDGGVEGLALIEIELIVQSVLIRDAVKLFLGFALRRVNAKVIHARVGASSCNLPSKKVGLT
jgi:hypothetical protein